MAGTQCHPVKKLAVVQSNYIPWKGYFDLIAAVDEFIIFDVVQYTRRDWRNRNLIKTPTGPKWLTVPVQTKGRFQQSIYQTRIDGTRWRNKHWKTLVQFYRDAKFFQETRIWLEPIYTRESFTYLSQLNCRLIEAICQYLEITTKLSHSNRFDPVDGKNERIVDLCLRTGATEYFSGPAAKAYLDEAHFNQNGIAVRWFDYAGYPEYEQIGNKFIHGLSILDLIFNCGKDARKYMKYYRQKSQ